MLAPLAAFMLMAASLIFVAVSLRLRHAGLSRRIDMIEAQVQPAVTERKQPASAGNLFRIENAGLASGETAVLARVIRRFGIPAERAALAFNLLRVVLVIVIGVAVFTWTRRFPIEGASVLWPLVAVVFGAVFGWFLPLVVVRRKVAQRTKIVGDGLPNALDLLVVCVEAGLSLEDGIDRVVEELRHSQPVLADELALTSADLKILPSRDQALQNFATRIDIPSVRSVITTLSQTLRYGTPLAHSLRMVASEMRNDHLVALEEHANKLPALLTVPVIIFLMPTIFLIVGGPAALRLIDTFSTFKLP
jgi:tight adherence protein C